MTDSRVLMPASIAIVTRAKGLFYKPLYESFSTALPEGWRTILIWPEQLGTEHPPELITPAAGNIEIRRASNRVMTFGTKALMLPSPGLWGILDEVGARLLLIHEFSPYTLLALIHAKLKGIPVILSTEIGRRNAHFFPWPIRAWHRMWGWFVDGIVACSPAAHEPLSGRKIPSVSAYHAMDSRFYKPTGSLPERTDSQVIFVYLGQLIHRKGLDLFLAAAAELLRSGHENFCLRIIGGGDELTLRRQIAQLGLTDHVELTGFLSGPAIRAKLESSDVFVLPTREDTYAAVVHEAACLGLPLLISKFAGASESLVVEAENGYVFDPHATGEFAALLGRLMDGETRERMRGPSREIGERFSAHRRGAAIWEWMEIHGFV